MELAEYLFYNNLSEKEFAEMCELSQSYVHKIKKKRIHCSNKVAKAISKATDGKVSIEEITKYNAPKKNYCECGREINYKPKVLIAAEATA